MGGQTTKMEMPMFGEEDKMIVIKKKSPQTKAQRGEQLFEEVQEFRKMVDIIIHTVNNNEKWAVLDHFDPPELYPGKPLSDRAVDLYEPNQIALGMFGGYRSALIQTEMGCDAREEVDGALDDFPNAKFVLAIGVAYATNPDKAKLGDVLVSKFIDGVGNIKYASNGMVIFRAGPTRFASVSQLLRKVFARGEETWDAFVDFKCAKIENSPEDAPRRSKVHSGLIISSHALVNNKEMRDNMTRNAPEAIGGEMEGVTILESLERASLCEFGVTVIKGVADYGDGEKVKVWQFTAAMAAASYAKHKLGKTDGKLFAEGQSGPSGPVGPSGPAGQAGPTGQAGPAVIPSTDSAPLEATHPQPTSQRPSFSPSLDLCIVPELPCGNSISASSLMERYQLKEEECTRQVSDRELDEISRCSCRHWKKLCSQLGMESIVEYDIVHSNIDEEERRRSFLIKWKHSKGTEATPKKLVSALLEIKCVEDAENVCKLLQRSTVASSKCATGLF